MLLLLSVVVVAGTVALLLRAFTFDRLQAHTIMHRVQAYTVDGQPTVAAKQSGSSHELIDSLAMRLGDRFGKTFDQEEARRQIMAAGLYTLTPQRLIGYRLLGATVPPVLWLMLGAANHSSPLLLFGGVALAGIGGWRLPVMHLDRKAKTRLAEIDYALPSLVDLLVVTVEAGVSLAGSLQLAAERTHGPLRDELRLTLKEQQMGLGTGDALKNMQARCPTPAMTTFVRSIGQTEQLGVSIGKIMRDLSDDMRSRRKASAEERANKAPVKMLFPLVFLIFPSMLAVLMGPAVLQLLKVFTKQ